MAASDSDKALATLERQVNELIALCERLVEANLLLLQNYDEIQQQQAILRRKNRKAAKAVDKIVHQLRPHGGPR